ncbi:hypothetical protein [Streptomyces cinereoruber]|uniref:hypothetical protein n=1 Tax=Streptomyces cinereoruber TaxID=67260 RepID=UPI00363B0F2B
MLKLKINLRHDGKRYEAGDSVDPAVLGDELVKQLEAQGAFEVETPAKSGAADEAKTEASTILAGAKAKAKQLVANAAAEADRIVKEAKAKAAELLDVKQDAPSEPAADDKEAATQPAAGDQAKKQGAK